jgi:hypothetical protein
MTWTTACPGFHRRSNPLEVLSVPCLVHAVDDLLPELLSRVQLLAIEDLLDLLEPEHGSSVVKLRARHEMDWWTYVRPFVSGKRKYCATSMAARIQTYCDIS